MKAFDYFQRLHYNLPLARLPVTIVHLVVLIITLFIQYNAGLTLWSTVLFICIFIVYNVFHWHSDVLITSLKSVYFYVQGLFILLCTMLMPDASPVIVLGLMAVFMIQGMYYFQQIYKVTGLVLGYACFYSVMMYYHFGWDYLGLFIALYIMLFVLLQLVLYMFNQKDAENLALQMANKKIEQLTIENERQRMARDLHDTLAQRLVGLILKLDASDAHLKKGNLEKVEEILLSAKEQARDSLIDARKVIDDLRMNRSAIAFQDVLIEEVAQLKYLYQLPIDVTFSVDNMPASAQEHIIAIVKESVTNVYKHAQATHITISLTESQQTIVVTIQDNGQGIHLKDDMSKKGHYGLLGMQERARLMNADLHISGQSGTNITVKIPII